MVDVGLYSKNNSMQRDYAIDVLNEFSPRFCWSNEENVLDVGSGLGDVSVEILLPQLPPNSFLMGVDINTEMVDYANKHYSNGKTKFKVLDFSTTNITHVLQEMSFSKILSFHCFHWIRNQQQVAKNISQLLRPGGEVFVVAAPTHSAFLIYQALGQMEEWKEYMKDVDEVIPYFYNSKRPCEDVAQLFISHGLEVITCEKRQQTVHFPNTASLIHTFEAINPFVKSMDRDTRQKYMTAYEQVIHDNQLSRETDTGEVLYLNEYIILHGRKPYKTL